MGAEINHEIELDELTPIIDGCRVSGMMIYGKATLISSDPSGDPKAFHVSEIEIDGGFILKRPRSMMFPADLRERLFVAIAEQIESGVTATGRYAQAEFSAAVDEAHEPDPDEAYDRRRDEQMMGVA